MRACWITLCVLLSACSKGPSASSAPDGGLVVAVVGERRLTADDFLRKLGEQPEFVRLRYGTLERKKEFLDVMVRQELLVQEARRRGIEQEPEVRELVEKVMVQRLIQKHTASAEPSDAEVKAFFDAHQAEFVRPERVRVSHYFLAAPKGDPKHEAAKIDAQKLLARLKSLTEPALSLAFREEVRKSSADVASKSLDGDLGLRSREELEQAWGPAVADAAMGLKMVSEVSAVIESEKGYHLLQLTGRQPGLNTALDEAKPRIATRLQAEVRSKALEQLVDSLRKAANVEIHDETLGRIQIAGPTGPLIPPALDGG